MNVPNRRLLRFFAFLLLLSCLTVLFSACGGEETETSLTDQLLFVFDRNGEARCYYTGEPFDGTYEDENGTYSLVPAVYILYADGTQSEDLSHSDGIRFSGYDPDSAGTQTISVEYTADGVMLRDTYSVEVRQTEILFLEAEDPFRRTLGSFHVGEEFSLSFTEEDGVRRGVTVWIHCNNPRNPRTGYFGDAPELADATFDTSSCKLDAAERFTEPGVFTVTVTYHDVKTTYEILVEE